MLAVTRKSRIRDKILEKKSVTVSELSQEFSVTEETIRRDLKALEDEGFLTRTYGGAFIQDGVENEVTMELRDTIYVDSKEAIARTALGLIHNGDTIFLDSSTTAYCIAKVIADMNLTVLTNSLMIIDLLSKHESIRLISIGGQYSQRARAFVGRGASRSLNDYYVDKTFMSCRSLSMEHGITDSNEDLAVVRQKLLERSNSVYVIADFSKFDKTSFISICPFTALTGVITDKALSPEWLNYLEENHVKAYLTGK